MLRDRSLIPLSQQHHNGLALCVLTLRSLAANRSPENLRKLARRIADRYELELVNHFEIEEQVLFPAVRGSLERPGILDQLIAEHRRMAAMVRDLETGPAPERLEEFCALLTAHIRREESELFSDIQQRTPRETLDALGVEIERRVVRICI